MNSLKHSAAESRPPSATVARRAALSYLVRFRNISWSTFHIVTWIAKNRGKITLAITLWFWLYFPLELWIRIWIRLKIRIDGQRWSWQTQHQHDWQTWQLFSNKSSDDAPKLARILVSSQAPSPTWLHQKHDRQHSIERASARKLTTLWHLIQSWERHCRSTQNAPLLPSPCDGQVCLKNFITIQKVAVFCSFRVQLGRQQKEVQVRDRDLSFKFRKRKSSSR